jgi:hypothetical protein
MLVRQRIPAAGQLNLASDGKRNLAAVLSNGLRNYRQHPAIDADAFSFIIDDPIVDADGKTTVSSSSAVSRKVKSVTQKAPADNAEG